MKRLVAVSAVVLVVSAMSACTTALKPNRCNQAGDCQSGFRCNLDPTPEGNGRCVAIASGDGGDAGVAGADGDARDLGAEAAAGGGSAGAAGGAGGGDAGVEVKPTCTDSQCTGTTPLCGSDGRCHSCADAVGGADAGANAGADAGPDAGASGPSCRAKNAALPACAASGACVACVASSDCAADPAKPICDTGTNVCVKCANDAQCVAKLGANPGVCMAHQDGRCATDGETIYVQKTASCMDATVAGAGTASQPLCTLEPLPVLVAQRHLVLVRGVVQAGTWILQQGAAAAEVSLVGQASASVGAGAGPALHISGASVYLRAIEFSASFDIGIFAELGSTLRTDTVLVDNSKGGGILVDKSNFDIRNTTLTGNGPGDIMGTSWGGIRINMPPTGPTTLDRVTIKDNKQVGLSCSGAITGTGVLATGNIGGVDISAACNVTPCTLAGPTCGATGS